MVWVVDMPLVLVVVAVADATVPVVDLVPLMTALPIVEFCVLVHVPVTIAVVPRAVLVLLKVTVQLGQLGPPEGRRHVVVAIHPAQRVRVIVAVFHRRARLAKRPELAGLAQQVRVVSPLSF